MFLKNLNKLFTLLMVISALIFVRSLLIPDIITGLASLTLFLLVALAKDNINQLLEESPHWYLPGTFIDGGLHSEDQVYEYKAEIQARRKSFKIVKGGK